MQLNGKSFEGWADFWEVVYKLDGITEEQLSMGDVGGSSEGATANRQLSNVIFLSNINLFNASCLNLRSLRVF
ncbi:MAG: hypothetical protein GY816_14985 [Cytophagales bacterium]|nr:hypothetical protein [Cytophagales bacterium]